MIAREGRVESGVATAQPASGSGPAIRFPAAGRNPRARDSLLDALDLYLSALRADLAFLETVRYRSESLLSCPISALWGNTDPVVDRNVILEWARHTSAAFREAPFPGGHFYLRSATKEILRRYRIAIEPEAIGIPCP